MQILEILSEFNFEKLDCTWMPRRVIVGQTRRYDQDTGEPCGYRRSYCYWPGTETLIKYDFYNEILLNCVETRKKVSYQKSFGVPNQDNGTNMAAMTSNQMQELTWTPAWNFKQSAFSRYTFLSDYLTDSKLHRTKKISSTIAPGGVWTDNLQITTLMLY